MAQQHADIEWVVVLALIVLWACLGASWHTATHPTRIIYSRDFLFSFKASVDTGPPPPDLLFPYITELYADSANGNFFSSSRHKIRKRGSRGGVRQRSRRPLARIPLPSIILANAQSLRNKTDDLQALVHTNTSTRTRASLPSLKLGWGRFTWTVTWLRAAIAYGSGCLDNQQGAQRSCLLVHK